MSDLTLNIKLTDAGLAAVAAAHGLGVQAKITHVAIGDQGYAPLASATALHHELARVALTAGGAVAPKQVLLQGMFPADGPEFFIHELGYFLEDGTLLGVWSDPTQPLGWIGGATPWFFKLVFAWSSLPADAITVVIADDAGQAGMALDLTRLEAKVRHTVEVGGKLEWGDADETQLTAAITAMIGRLAPALAAAAPPMDGVGAAGQSAKVAREDHRHPTDTSRAPLASPSFTGAPSAPTAPTGTATTQLATTAFVQAAVTAASLPPGVIVFFPTSWAPSGFLKCNGAAVSRTAYAALFAVIGTYYGVGDGYNTFNLPEPRGTFPRFLDDGRGIDPGRVVGSVQSGSLLSHDHGLKTSVAVPGFGELVFRDFGDARGDPWIELPPAVANDEAATGYRVATFATGGNENRPLNFALLPCIKY